MKLIYPNRVIKILEELQTKAVNRGINAAQDMDSPMFNYCYGEFDAYEKVIEILRGEQE